jgi:hypothetical protein
VWDGSQWVTAADRTSVTIANGLVTAGRLEVGTAALSSNNAGVNGAVTASPNTDVRFWAGSTWANSATAPFRVQNDGKLFATGATITGDLTVTSGTTYDAIQNSLRQHLVSGDTVEVFRFQKGTTGSRGTPPSGYGSKYSIRPYESLFGDSCIAIEETTTNLVSANALSVLNNFSTKGLTATLTTLTETFLGTPITRVTYVASTDASGALTSMKNSNVTAASTNNGIQHAFGTYASNTPYSASIYWRSNRPGLVVTGIQSAGAVWANNTTVALGGGWYRTTCTHSEATVRTEAKYWVFYDTLLALGETVQIDWVCHQVEQKAFPTSYGTRTAPGILSIPTLGTQLNFGKFSIVGWIKRDVTGIKQTICGVSPKPIFSINASNYLQLDWLDSGNIARQYITTLSVADKNWHLVGFSWDQLNANCIFFLDGSSETKTGVIQTLSSTASSGFAFGVSTVGVTGDIGNMLYSNFVVNKTNNFTAAEVLKMYNTRRPFVDTAPINTAPNASGISSTYS